MFNKKKEQFLFILRYKNIIKSLENNTENRLNYNKENSITQNSISSNKFVSIKKLMKSPQQKLIKDTNNQSDRIKDKFRQSKG